MKIEEDGFDPGEAAVLDQYFRAQEDAHRIVCVEAFALTCERNMVFIEERAVRRIAFVNDGHTIVIETAPLSCGTWIVTLIGSNDPALPVRKAQTKVSLNSCLLNHPPSKASIEVFRLFSLVRFAYEYAGGPCERRGAKRHLRIQRVTELRTVSSIHKDQNRATTSRSCRPFLYNV